MFVMVMWHLGADARDGVYVSFFCECVSVRERWFLVGIVSVIKFGD